MRNTFIFILLLFVGLGAQAAKPPSTFEFTVKNQIAEEIFLFLWSAFVNSFLDPEHSKTNFQFPAFRIGKNTRISCRTDLSSRQSTDG